MAKFKCINCGEISDRDILRIDSNGKYVLSNKFCLKCDCAALRYVGPSPQTIQQQVRNLDPYNKCRQCSESWVNSRGKLVCKAYFDNNLRPRDCKKFSPKY